MLAILLLALLLLLAWGPGLFDEPLRRQLESRMNRTMHGFTLQLGHAHASPLDLSLTLADVTLRAQDFPEPPVAVIPVLRLGLRWPALLSGRVIGQAVLEHPHLYINVPQLHVERLKRIRQGLPSWQQSFTAGRPLALDSARIEDGSLVYLDEDPRRPILVDRWTVTATQIDNRRRGDRVYPSPVHSEGRILGSGRGVFDGHASLLTDPFPSWLGRCRIADVPLDGLPRFRSPHVDLDLRGGRVAAHGGLEYGPAYKVIGVEELRFDGTRFDYVHLAPAAEAERARREEAFERASLDGSPKPTTLIDRLVLEDGEAGYVNRATDPPYRIAVHHARLEIDNLSERVASLRRQGVVFRVRGRFAGGGTGAIESTWKPGAPSQRLGAEVAIENAPVAEFRDAVRAYEKLDVAGGVVSIYSQLTVEDQRLHGYVKVLARDVQMAGGGQEPPRPMSQKIKEKVAEGLAHLLANRRTGELATRTELSGTASAPKPSMSEIIAGLLRNTFGKPITPGFDTPAKR